MDVQEGKMMKIAEKMKHFVFGLLPFVVVLCILASFAAGCRSFAQLGETGAEGSRRHARNRAIKRQEMMADIDALLLTDKPSRLTDKRIP